MDDATGAFPPEDPPPDRALTGRGGGAPALRPLGVGEVLDAMFRLLVRHWRAYLLALGAILVPVNLLAGYLGERVGGGAGSLSRIFDPAAAAALRTGPDLAAIFGLFGLGVVNTVLVTPLVTGTACRIAATAVEGRDPSAGSSLRAAASRYAALVAANLLSLVVPFLALVPGIGLLAAAAFARSRGLAIGGGLLLLVGFVAMAVLFALFAFVYPAVIVEGAGPVRALRRSAALVRGRFWPVVGALLLAVLVAVLVGVVVTVPANIVGAVVGGVVGFVLGTLGSVLAAVVTAPLLVNAQTLLYFDARVRREALDLERLAERIEGTPATFGGSSA